MTRFIGDAIGVRAGKGKPITGKDMKKNMKQFLENGKHPELEAAQQERDSALPPLPERDINHSFVFIDISVGGKPSGRLLIELFCDQLPAAGNHFRNRCLPGSSASLSGTSFHKLIPHYAAFGSKSANAGEGMQLSPYRRLQSVDAGTVSISFNGEEIAIALARALVLDTTHQVVGRITKGMEVLDALNDVRTLPDDSPVHRITITSCGPTNHLGVHESLSSDGAALTPVDEAAKLRQESAKARGAVMEALRVGLGNKSSSTAVPTPGSDTSSAAGSKRSAEASTAAGAMSRVIAAAANSRNVKSKFMDTMLGGDSSSSDDEGDS